MSTNNLSDEELDDLFRKSAESFDPPYDPEDWKAMEKKLDRVERGNSGWYKTLYTLLLIIGMTSFIAVIKLVKEPEAEAPVFSENSLSGEMQKPAGKPVEKALNPLQEEQNIPFDHQPVTRPARAAAKMPGGERKTESQGNNIVNRTTLYAAAEAKATGADVTEELAEHQIIAGSNRSSNQISIAATNQPDVLEPEQPDTLSAATPTHLDEKEEFIPDTDSNPAPAIKSRSAFLSSVQFIALVAPDITTVKFRNPDAISANAGIMIGVPVTKKISILSGVIWANKVYGADPESYAPSTDYWYGRRLPSTIDATCKVLDIPLNIRYLIYERDRNSIALQAGISSYLMLEENYTYIYDNYIKTIEISNENKHWFAVNNLSVSYNRKLTSAISVGVEPFVKIPLTGIGAGNVKLTSAGIFFTAGYTLPLKK